MKGVNIAETRSTSSLGLLGRSPAKSLPPLIPFAAPELYEEILLDFPTECLPAIGIYPDHEDQPYVDIAAVGRWVARCLPRLAELRFECRHSRTYNNPSFDANVAMGERVVQRAGAGCWGERK